MTIYLLYVDAVRRIFYSDGREFETEASEPRHRGVVGWCEGRLGRLRSEILHAEGGVALRVRRIWEWLQRFRHPDERLLVSLRKAPRLEIRHPAAMAADAARSAWDEYLRSRLGRHYLWLVFNAALVPITALLAILPGPNIIGYWFAYRAVHHFLVLIGLHRAKRGRIPTTFHPSEWLNLPLAEAEKNGHPHPALGRDPLHLDEFLERAPAYSAPAESDPGGPAA